MATTKVQNLTNIGTITTGDKLVGERVAGTTGTLTFAEDITLDTAPVLGGNLDVGTYKIVSGNAVDLQLLPGTTGAVLIGGNATQATPLRFLETSGNGTNYVALAAPSSITTNTTYTLPVAPTVSGQLLASTTGGAMSWTTPTYPASSATSGKILQSDGTNFIASTPTFPTSAGASGTRLRSNGTNYINSTTSLPDSGTSRKLIVGDGTNYVETTETWAVPGTSGKVLQSDGTNWTSATPTGTGAPVLQTSPSLVTPALGTVASGVISACTSTSMVMVTPVLGTPTSGTLTNCTGLPMTTGVTGVLPVANGGTNASAAGIAAFNNITGYTAAGATGTTSTNLVFSTSPTLVTPVLGTPSSGTLSSCTGYAQSALTGLGANISTFLGTPSSANLAAAITDETGSGVLVFGTAPTFTTGITTPKVTFNSTSGIIGTTTNNDADAGSVGEFTSATVTRAAAVALTTVTSTNVTSISLTAGDWDVWGNVGFAYGATTNTTYMYGWVSSSSATLPADHLSVASSTPSAGLVYANDNTFTVLQRRFSLSATTTIYLSVHVAFTISTCSAFGGIYARRIR